MQAVALIKDYIPSWVHCCRMLFWLKITFLPVSVSALTSLCQTLHSFLGPSVHCFSVSNITFLPRSVTVLLCLSAAAFLCETSETKILDIKIWWAWHGQWIVMKTESWNQLKKKSAFAWSILSIHRLFLKKKIKKFLFLYSSCIKADPVPLPPLLAFVCLLACLLAC